MTLHPSFHSEFTRYHEHELRQKLARPTRPRRDRAKRTEASSEALPALVRAAQSGDRAKAPIRSSQAPRRTTWATVRR
jgi:hypothetical protein